MNQIWSYTSKHDEPRTSPAVHDHLNNGQNSFTCVHVRHNTSSQEQVSRSENCSSLDSS